MKREMAENLTRVALIVVPVVLVLFVPGLFDLDTWLGLIAGPIVVFGQLLLFLWLPEKVGAIISNEPRGR